MEKVGVGHGVKERFGGLPDSFSEETTARFVILPVPFDMTTTYQKGTDKGPSAIIEASHNLELYDIETDSEIFRDGIYTAPPIIAKSSEEMIEMTYQAARHYISEGKFLITIGGEHSISYAPIKAYGEFFKPITVLQLDAHADLYLKYEDNPWSHASAMARVKELEHVPKVVSVGIRSLSYDELPYVDRKNTFFAQEIYDNEEWIDDVLDLLKGPIYITIDLDVFDTSIMPSTGTPEPGGLKWYSTLKLLKRVAEEKELIGFDVVELLPNSYNVAPDFLAAKLIYKLMSYTL